MNNLVTRNFNAALSFAETKALYDLDDKWCVCLRYGTFGAFPLSFALDRDYAIVSVTIY